MLRWVLVTCVQFRSLVLVVAAGVLIFGAYRLRDASVDALPEFSPPIVQIQTEALGLSAAEVEELVTLNLEEILTSVPWLKTIRSKSITGLSSILLVFDPGTDLMRARQMVQERLNLAHMLPNVSSPPVMLQPLSTTSRAMIVGLSAKDISLIDASVLVRWTITPKLLGVPGVANVSAWGMRSRQLQVQAEPQRLQDYGVTLGQLVRSAGDAMWVSPLSYLEASTPGTGGWIDTPNQRLGIHHVQPIVSASDLAKVPIVDTDLRIEEVAQVVEEHPLLIGDAIINNRPGLMLVIEKLPHANSYEVVRGIGVALDELRRGLPGVEIDTSIYRATNFIDLSKRNLAVALVVGGLLLVLVFGVWLQNWRTVFIATVAVSVSVMAAALVLHLRGTTINAIVLAGLAAALAAVIDDAIIDIENVARRLRARRQRGGEMSAVATICEACFEIRRPMLYATLILVLAVAPVLLATGALGAFVNPFAVSYALALVSSLVVAAAVTPALAVALMRRSPPAEREPRLMQWVRRRYEMALPRVAGTHRLVLLVAGVVIVAGFAALPSLNWSLLPSFKERDVRVSWASAPGTSLPEMRRVMMRATAELRSIPGVRNVTGHIGRAITGDQVVGVDAAQLWINIDRGADYSETLAAIRSTVEGYPGLDVDVETYLNDRMKSILTGAGEPVVVRLQGPQREILRQEAETVAKVLSNVPGIVGPRVESQSELPQVEIRVDLAAAGRFGVKPGDVRRAVATIFAGLDVGHLFDQQKVFEIVVWGSPRVRQSVNDVRELLIDTPNYDKVRLADIADVRIVPTPAVIEREGVSRRIDIRANVAGRNLGTVLRDVEERLSKIEFPLEYHATLIGSHGEQQIARWQAVVIAIAAAIGVYLVLQACFQSWYLALLPCIVAIVAIAGGLLTMLAVGTSVTFGSLAGCLAVFGLTIRNSILLINRYQSDDANGAAGRLDPIQRAASARIGPILITSTAIAAVLLPVLVIGGDGGLEILQPMAVVLLAGTVTAAIMNLFGLPVLVSASRKNAERRKPVRVGQMRNDAMKVATAIIICLAVASLSGGSLSAAETGKASGSVSSTKPAKLEEIPGSDLHRVILTARAAERLAIEIAEVRDEVVTSQSAIENKVAAAPTGRGDLAAAPILPVATDIKAELAGLRKVVPYSAVIYDAHGVTWVYTTPEPLTFVRQRIVVDHIEGDRAVLKEGPDKGTRIVTVGAALLLGVEQKFGH